MEAQQHGDQLKRGLKNRHIQLIALGGAIGTGLFLGSASVIQSAGPGIILGYAIAGFIAFLIMRQLGEMVVEEPVAGSFSHFAYKYWGSFAGFASGWNRDQSNAGPGSVFLSGAMSLCPVILSAMAG